MIMMLIRHAWCILVKSYYNARCIFFFLFNSLAFVPQLYRLDCCHIRFSTQGGKTYGCCHCITRAWGVIPCVSIYAYASYWYIVKYTLTLTLTPSYICLTSKCKSIKPDKTGYNNIVYNIYNLYYAYLIVCMLCNTDKKILKVKSRAVYYIHIKLYNIIYILIKLNR